MNTLYQLLVTAVGGRPVDGQSLWTPGEEEVGEGKRISPAFRLLAVLGESELLKAALVKRS